MILNGRGWIQMGGGIEGLRLKTFAEAARLVNGARELEKTAAR